MLRCTMSLLATLLAIPIYSQSLAQVGPTEPDEAQIRRWISELANTSPERRFQGPNDRLTPEERDALKPVQRAYENLTRHFLSALPYLVEGMNDQRFSYPQEHPTSGVFENQTVGDACRNIIQRKVLPLNPSVIDDRGIAVELRYPISKQWYSRARGQSLFQMQVEALEWALKQGPPARVSKEEWGKEQARVRAFQKDFIGKGKAIDETFGPPIEGK